MSQRKLIRPDISDKRGSEPRAVTRRKLSPPEQTNAEEFYYLKQMSARTPMAKPAMLERPNGKRTDGSSA